MVTPTHKPTKEQEAVLNSKAALRLTIANAGSGKTTLMAMLFAKLYLQEEAIYKQQNPNKETSEGHLTDPTEISKICNQIEAITFTKKAAAELDARIRKMLMQQGVNIPTVKNRAGREIPWRIARTIDSKVQQIFFHPLFLKSYVQCVPEWQKQLEWMVQQACINEETNQWLQEKAETDNYSQDTHWAGIQIWQAWGCQLLNQEQNALVELVILEHLGWVRNYIEKIKAKVGERLREANKADWENGRAKSVCEPVMKELMEIVGKASERFAEARQRLNENTDELTAEQRKQLVEYVEPHTKKERLVKEFTTAYELARRKGYKPGNTGTGLTNRDVITAIAEMGTLDDGEVSLVVFDSLCQKLEDAKRHLGMLDFGDFMDAILIGLTNNSFLVEVGKPYPRLGFRRRHVILDESQDQDCAQWQLAELWQKATGGGSINIVGDVGQSIYGWRGADPEGIESLLKGEEGDAYEKFHLSHCFRSAPEVVALGNEIIQTLSQYRNEKKPSIAAHKNLKGTVEVWGWKGEADEAEKVTETVAKELGKGRSVMVLYRSNGEKRAVARALRKAELIGEGKAQFLSTHQAKGLEADTVIMTGLTAGLWPDPRGDEQQEVNLFYVACTRARTRLILSCPTKERILNEDGEFEEELVGPSPFIQWIPSLAKMAEKGKLSLGLLEIGKETHAKCLAERSRMLNQRKRALENEATEMGGIKNGERRPTAYAGGKALVEANEAWLAVNKPEPEQGDTVAGIQKELEKKNAERKLDQLPKELYRLLLRMELIRDRITNRLPKLDNQDWQQGFRAGWWNKAGTYGKWQVSARYLAVEAALAARRRRRKV